MKHRQAPRLYRLAYAASRAGMTPALFLLACQKKQIPITVSQIGDRELWMVDAREFLTWMGPTAPAGLANLFD